MESDVPLIEIAREDDSLLQLIPDDAVSSSNTNKTANDDAYFFRSPLQPCRSNPPEGVMGSEKSRKPSSRFCRDGNIINKENTDRNANKIEEQKLSLLPQQMKRKKKGGGGGYNLRKSLAWDRAFFTEEGVLNSEELSMISGNASSNGLLSIIEEDGNCITDSVDLEATEEKLFKVMPLESPSSKDRIGGGSSLPKHGSATSATPGSAARRKVLSVRDVNRSGSKRSGCPRPVGSSSLKRPANVNTMKSPAKEPKVSRFNIPKPVPKPDPCLLSRASKNVTAGANDLKRNQIAQPVRMKNTKAGPNNVIFTPTGKSVTPKSSARQARRNVASLVKGSPTKIPYAPTTKANNGLEMNSKQELPSIGYPSYGREDRSRKTAVPQVISKQAVSSTSHASYGRNDRSGNTAVPEVISKQALPSTGHPSSSSDDRSRKTAVPLPHTSVNLQCTQLPTEKPSKPSGLRMPSPSLGFFNQPKAKTLPVPLKTSSQPCVIPNPRQVGSVDPIHESRPPSSLREKKNVISDGKLLGDSNVQCSSSGCPVSSTANPATKNIKPFLQVTNTQKLEKVQSSSNSYDVTENQRKFKSIPVHENQHSMGQAETCITEKLFHMDEVEFQIEDDKFLLQSRSCEQVDKDDNTKKVALVLTPISKDKDKPHFTSHLCTAAKFPCSSGRNDITDHQIFEDKSHDLPQKNNGVFLKSNSKDASSSSSILISYDGQSSGDHNVNELHGERDDLFKPLTCEGNRISDEDQMVCENTGSFTKDCQASEEIQSYICVKVACVSPQDQNSSASELKRSDALSDSRFEGQAKDDGSVDSNPHVGDAHMLVLGGRLTDEMNDVGLNTSAPDNCQLMITDCVNEKPEQLELPSSHYIRDLVFPENRLRLNDCVLDGFSIFPEETQQKNALQCVESKEPEGTGACRSEVSRTLSLIPPAMLDCASNVVEIVESQNVDNIASVSGDNKSVVENYNLDRNGFHCQDSSLESEGMDEVQITDAVTTDNNNATFSKSGDFTSQITLNVQVEGGSEIKDVNEQNNLGTKDCNLSVESYCHVSQLQPEDDKSCCEQGTSTEQISLMSDKINFTGEQINAMSGKINAGKRNVEQAKLVMSCCDVEDRTLNQIPEAKGRESFEECHAYRDGNSENISLKLKGSGGTSLQSPCGLSKHKSLDEANKEVDGGSDMIKESFPVDPPEQSSVSDSACSTVVNNVCYELSGCSELRNLSSGVVRASQDINHGTLLANCNESKETVQEVALDDYDACGSESKSSELAPAMHDGRPEEKRELKKLGSERKRDALVIKPPSDAVPFSDEWLAALEAAGEEILTKKSGAVQNSPPNKSKPQLGPWSPVKRKTNQVIGPFDCTKHTNNPPNSQ